MMLDAIRRRVCVIGAGISGLVTAKVLANDGFDVVVFEKEPTLGGVWAASRTYPGLRTNNPRDTYAFSDHPFPSTAADFPSASEMRAYLHSYAERFGVLARVRLGTEVVKIAWAPLDGPAEGMWKVTVRSREAQGQPETLDFDFVVICNGVFCEPRVPSIEGMDRFAGRALHSSTLSDGELVKGKRVLVVGGSKSALDCAAWAAHEGQSCTLVFRQAYWMWPRYLFGVINIQWLMFSRLSASFLRYYRLSRAEAWLHGIGRPLVRFLWRSLTSVVRMQSGVEGPLLPEAPLPRNFESVGIGTDVYALVRQGRIQPKKTTIRRFRRGNEVELASGEVLEADLVIFATGFQQQVPFLEESVRRRVEREDGFHLYRLILPPEVPRLGFIGYNSSTACQLTSEVAAHWLSQRFLGTLWLPSVEAMNREIARVRQWTAEVMPARNRGYFVGPHVVHYVDDLMRDMGLATVRTSNFIAENFLPTWPSRYRTIAEERRRVRSAPDGRARARAYVSGAHAFGVALIAAFVWMLWAWQRSGR